MPAVLADSADVAALGITTGQDVGREELMPGAFEAFWKSPTYSHRIGALPGTYRGAGSWQRTVTGIRAAQGEELRVRVAATLCADQAGDLDGSHDTLDSINIARADLVIPFLGPPDVAGSGLELTVQARP